MPGFMPGIHALASRKGVDGRDKPGHDSQMLLRKSARQASFAQP
jgi:hypothetical protein